MPTAPVSSLYEHIGGAPALTTLVDRFYEHLWADSSLNKYFVGIDRNELKAHQRMFLNLALGGGEFYTGKPLKEAHQDLRIDDAAFDKVAEHLRITMRELEIDEPAIAIIDGAVKGFRRSVVTV
ncbi:MAG: group 1 truncated hemoglobin [Actinobacteria bacterium]|nr:group 1 truncated hemoglobin [Actinomycetota bacterium]